MGTLLRLLARHGRLVLIAGLAAGVALPSLAHAMRPWIGEMIALLLFLAALRIGPKTALGTLADLTASLGLVLVYQLALPVAVATGFMAAGLTGAIPLALVLMLAASPLSGGPSLTMMMGHDAAPALRLLVVGTAVLPATVIPALWLSPAAGTAGLVVAVSLRLLAIIAVAAGLAFAVRHWLWPAPRADQLGCLDGSSAVVMAVIVVGLMSAVGPALVDRPADVVATLALAFAMNFGLQIASYLTLARAGTARVAYAINAGNRNMGLFLAVLPAGFIDQILLYLGCYQITMYLTPTLMRPLYR